MVSTRPAQTQHENKRQQINGNTERAPLSCNGRHLFFKERRVVFRMSVGGGQGEKHQQTKVGTKPVWKQNKVVARLRG